MTIPLNQLTTEAMRLQPSLRLKLAQALLVSLNEELAHTEDTQLTQQLDANPALSSWVESLSKYADRLAPLDDKQARSEHVDFLVQKYQ